MTQKSAKAVVGKLKTLNGLIGKIKLTPKHRLQVNDLVCLKKRSKTQAIIHSFSAPDEAVCIFLNHDPLVRRGSVMLALGHSITVPVGPEVKGRMFNALGQSIDGGADLSKLPRRPVNRFSYTLVTSPRRPQILETGIKVIDFFAPFVKGRKIGIIGGAGVGKTVLTMELMRNVSQDKSNLSFFVGIGERIREGYELYQTMAEHEVPTNVVMYFGQMDENPALRALVGHSAATVAEYFRDEQKKDLLFFIDNAYRFVQAGSELSTMMDQVPSEGGYQSTMYSDLRRFEERLYSSAKGSITTVQTVYIPADDLTDPAVLEIQQQLDSVIVLSRAVAEAGIRPAVDLVRTSSNLLTPDIVGDRHYILATQVQQIMQKHENLKNIVAIVGENELSLEDRVNYRRAQRFIEFFAQEPSVTEDISGIKGQYFTREQTLAGVEEILI